MLVKRLNAHRAASGNANSECAQFTFLQLKPFQRPSLSPDATVRRIFPKPASKSVATTAITAATVTWAAIGAAVGCCGADSAIAVVPFFGLGGLARPNAEQNHRKRNRDCNYR